MEQFQLTLLLKASTGTLSSADKLVRFDYDRFSLHVSPFIRRILNAGRHELPFLVLSAILLIAIWGFVEVAEEVTQGDTHEVDQTILLAMRNPADLSDPVGPHWMEEAGRDVTALGGMIVLTLVTLATIGYLLLMKRSRTALFVLIAVGGGILVSTFLKAGFERPRPDLVPHESYVYTASFPSGHSMLSAVTYLTLGALLARIHESRRVKVYFLSLAVLLTVFVGISRVYMGVHWPSDVLAGWAAGAVWALLCWLVALRLQQRGMVEPSVEDSEGTPQLTDGRPRHGHKMR